MTFWKRFGPLALMVGLVFSVATVILPDIAPGLVFITTPMQWVIYGAGMLVVVGLAMMNIVLFAGDTPDHIRSMVLPPERWKPASSRKVYPGWQMQRWFIAIFYAVWVFFLLLAGTVIPTLPDTITGWQGYDWVHAVLAVAGIWVGPLLISWEMKNGRKAKPADGEAAVHSS